MTKTVKIYLDTILIATMQVSNLIGLDNLIQVVDDQVGKDAWNKIEVEKI